jgi:WD40 repeat protein
MAFLSSYAQDHIASLAWAPDGMQIISSHEGENMYLWDAQSGAQILVPFAEQEDPITSVAISCDGQQFISGSDSSFMECKLR